VVYYTNMDCVEGNDDIYWLEVYTYRLEGECEI